MGHPSGQAVGRERGPDTRADPQCQRRLGRSRSLSGDKGASYVAAPTDSGGVKASPDFTGETIGSGELMGDAVVIEMNGTDEYITLRRLGQLLQQC